MENKGNKRSVSSSMDNKCNKRSVNSSKENKRNKRSVVSRNWAHMNYDILVKIFTMVSTMDLITNVSRVCPSWRAVCSHPSFWRSLDMARLKCKAEYPYEKCPTLDPRVSMRLMRILNRALFLSGNNVTRLIIHFQPIINDSHLFFAAERCPSLKQLVLPTWNQITEHGFYVAIQKLSQLESLTLPFDFFPASLLHAIGVFCPKLTELKVMCAFNHDFANTLFIYIPKLKVLSLRCTMVHKDALRLVLTLFDDLKVLNISHSLLVDFVPNESLTIFRWQDASFSDQISRLEKFFSCQSPSCIMCQRVYNDAGYVKWCNYEEDLWREDEIDSFSA